MCEPTHSINQVPPTMPDSGDPIPVETIFGKIGDWMKKVGDFFHFSKLGSGHSDAIRYAQRHHAAGIPEPIRYEASWWNRKVQLDMPWSSLPRHIDEKDALECATGYAHQVSIGNLSMVRRFLETSMAKTNQPGAYLEHLRRGMLNDAGILEYDKRVKLIGRPQPYRADAMKDYYNKLMKMGLGLTRKRHLLVPEWADDTKLWVPEERKIIMGPA